MSRRDDEHADYPSGGHRRQRGDNGDELSNSALETPVDLAAVQADDALLDMLGGAGSMPGGSDADLSRVLVAWRREVDAEPVGELVDTDTAMAVISAARRPAPRRHPMLVLVAAAAAVLVLAFSGVGLVAKSAEPGDRLWSLTKVLYADYARSAEAVKNVQDDLDDAQQALNQGNSEQAKKSLEQAEHELPVIQDPGDHTDLANKHDQLKEKLKAMPATSESAPPAQPGASRPPASPNQADTTLPESTTETSPSAAPTGPTGTTPPTTSSAPPQTPAAGPEPNSPPASSVQGPSSPAPRTVPDGSSTVAPTQSSASDSTAPNG